MHQLKFLSIIFELSQNTVEFHLLTTVILEILFHQNLTSI